MILLHILQESLRISKYLFVCSFKATSASIIRVLNGFTVVEFTEHLDYKARTSTMWLCQYTELIHMYGVAREKS